MNETPRMIDAESFPEIRVVRFRECVVSDRICDTPDKVYEYWKQHVPNAPWYIEDREHAVVFMFNTRRRIIGMTLAGIGSLDTVLCHARDVFRAAIVQNAAGIVFAHNHPSGDPTPSEADVKVTRDFIRGGQLLKIELFDSIIVGRPLPDQPKAFTSLRELGYFYS